MSEAEVVTLCGSLRFADEFLAVHRRLSLEGCVVLLPALPVGDDEVSAADRASLGVLHRRKIAMADRVHVLDLGGYVGEATASEIAYATSLGKRVTYESLPAAPLERG